MVILGELRYGRCTSIGNGGSGGEGGGDMWRQQPHKSKDTGICNCTGAGKGKGEDKCQGNGKDKEKTGGNNQCGDTPLGPTLSKYCTAFFNTGICKWGVGCPEHHMRQPDLDKWKADNKAAAGRIAAGKNQT